MHMEDTQTYNDAHAEGFTIDDLPNLVEAGVVTKYIVEASQDSNLGMDFIGNVGEEIVSLITKLHVRDSCIQTYDDIAKSLEADLLKCPAIHTSTVPLLTIWTCE